MFFLFKHPCLLIKEIASQWVHSYVCVKYVMGIICSTHTVRTKTLQKLVYRYIFLFKKPAVSCL